MISKINVFIYILTYYVFLSVIYTYATEILRNSNENFGPYILEVTDVIYCRGPKVRNSSIYSVDVDNNRTSPTINMNFTYMADTRITEFKINIYNVKKNNRSNSLWTYNRKNPCNHYFFNFIFSKYIGSKNCLAKKGTYHIMMEVDELAHSYLGPNFFYGQIYIKAWLLSQQGNLLCIQLNCFCHKK
ncbi:unnamed protein product [Chilo suppressalis]|uniref:MD-2-related lipid-recognition domain-containing protein n=1 Tax=Chilo suppressalis TaxID=168631 RepID=A0ABN8B0H0_CHISP|nr:unnamed protein product [Chilo suppressalis]